MAALLTDNRRPGRGGGPDGDRQRPRRSMLPAATLVALAAAVAVLATSWPRSPAGAADGDGDEVRILSAEPATLDPAAQGDIGSASVTAQLFESVTALDPSLTVRPALAERWEILEDGRLIVFHLRSGLSFSDGSPLTAQDVVRSWLRIVDPASPSPLASLMADVQGAEERLAGADASVVGLTATGSRVEVRLVRPTADFVAIVAGPTFAVVPPGTVTDGPVDPAGFIGSGAYILRDVSATELTLEASDRYWAGRPPIDVVHLVTDLGGRSPVAAFEEAALDYTSISGFDASWVRYDEALGPALREVPSLSVEYLGFDTSRPPFDDVRVRRAFGSAVDWRRLVALADGADGQPANSMVPPGIPGRSDRDFLPPHDPDEARRLLAEAGFPEGDGLGTVTFLTGGSGYAGGIVTDLERELGVDVAFETMPFAAYSDRLEDDPPPIWSMGWVADYPGRNDFLGVLLRTGSGNNYGRWSNAEFDAAVAAAGGSADPAAANVAYDDAEAILQREVPVIPLAYGPGWALARDGLLGAGQNGLGMLRIAGMAWDE